MKTMSLILILGLSNTAFALSVESLKANSEWSFLSGGISITNDSLKVIPTPSKDASVDYDMNAKYYTRMEKRSQQMKAFAEKLNTLSESKPDISKDYIEKISDAASELRSALPVWQIFLLGRPRDMKAYSMNIYEKLAQLKFISQTIKNGIKATDKDHYYDWYVYEAKADSDYLDLLNASMRKNFGWLYEFTVPYLRYEKLRPEWKKFIKERKDQLDEWEKLYVEGKMDFSRFMRLVETTPQAIMRWELYQEDVIRQDALLNGKSLEGHKL